MEVIEWELFHVREKTWQFMIVSFNLICTKSWWYVLKKSSSKIRKWTWLFMKCSLSNLFAWSRDDIYWMGISTLSERIWQYIKSKVSLEFTSVLMAFIEWKLFRNKRMNLTVYENLPVDFICTESWRHLLKGWSSTIRDGPWPFTIGSLSILFARIPAMIDWRELFTIREGTWWFMKSSPSILFAQGRDDIYWMGALPR
jgi:hypothetical protein